MGDVVQCQLSKSLQMLSASSPGNQVTASLSSLSKFSLSVVTTSGGCSPLPSEVPDTNEAVRKKYSCFCMRCYKAKEPVTPAAPPPAPVKFGGLSQPLLNRSGTICHESSEEGLIIVSWRKDMALKKWQSHNKMWIKFKVIQVTFGTTASLG